MSVHATHVLMVDDDPLMQRSLDFTLTQAGYRVTARGNAEDALVHLDADMPDLVLLDIGLPGMDGLDALHLSPRIFDEIGNGGLLCQDSIECIRDYLAKNLPNSVVGLCYYIYDIGQEKPFYPLRMFWRDEDHKVDINL